MFSPMLAVEWKVGRITGSIREEKTENTPRREWRTCKRYMAQILYIHNAVVLFFE